MKLNMGDIVKVKSSCIESTWYQYPIIGIIVKVITIEDFEHNILFSIRFKSNQDNYKEQDRPFWGSELIKLTNEEAMLELL